MMRFAKAFVGWLCVFSWLGAIGFGVWWLYLETAPFFRGGAIYRYHSSFEDPGELARAVAPGGLGSNDNSTLRDYVLADAQPRSEFRGWGALAFRITYGPVQRSPTPTRMVAAVLIDPQGRPVASYPGDLAGRLPPLRPGLFDQWKETAMLAAQRLQPLDCEAMVYDVFENGVVASRYDGDHAALPPPPGGPRIGMLALLAKRPNALAVIPPEADFRYPLSASDKRMAHLVWVVLLIAFWVLLAVWAALDAAWRGMRPFAWGLLVFLTGLIGFAAYMIARLPGPRPCPNCGEQVYWRYVRCPSCGASLTNRCPICGARMKAGWQYCPRCSGVRRTPPHKPEVPPTPAAPPLPPTQFSVLAVEVIEESGTPIPNARVLIEGPTVLEGMTNAAGRFYARRLKTGGYKVAAAKEGRERAETELDIGEESCEVVRLILRTVPGTISGRVLDRAARGPIVDARVYLDSTRIDRSTASDAGGAFTLPDIPPGPYMVCVEAEGFSPQTKLAEVVPGGCVEVEFGLTPEGPLPDPPRQGEGASAEVNADEC